MNGAHYIFEHFRRRGISATLAVFVLLAVFPVSAEKFVIHDEPKPVPKIEFARADGHPVSLENLRGKVVLFNIWATWCAPCRKEMPALDRLQAKLGGRDFEVVALSVDWGNAGRIRKFYDETGIENLNIYIDSSRDAMRRLKIVGLPATFLFDRKGREIGMLVGPTEWDMPEMVAFLRKQIAGAARREALSRIRSTQN